MKRILFAVAALAAAVALAAPVARLTSDARGLAASAADEVVLLAPVAGTATAGAFPLADGTVVLTDEATTWRGVDSAVQLGVGDLVRVEGSRRDANTVAAHQVARLLAAAPPTVLQGLVALITPPADLVLASGDRVTTDAATDWLGIGGWDELRPGDAVRVTGAPAPGSPVLLASLVERLAPAAPAVVVVEDTVTSVSPPDRFALRGGLELEVGPGTLYHGLAGVEELTPGDPVRVEARSVADGARLEALAVTRIAVPDGLVELLATVAVVATDRFTTTDGWEVVVGPQTTLTGFGGLGELAPGDAVAVTGRPGDGARTLLADAVVLGGGEDSGSGLEAGGEGLVLRIVGVVASVLLPDRLVLTSETGLSFDSSTRWSGGVTGLADLEPGSVVEANARYARDGRLVAETLTLLATAAEGLTTLSGRVVNLEPPSRVLLSGGEWVVIDELTELDGDVDSVAEIAIGVLVTADCVPLGESQWRALSARVESLGTDSATPWTGPWTVLAEIHEALVILAPGADPGVVAARHGAELVGTLPGILVHLMRWPSPLDEQGLSELLTDPEVEEVEPNLPYADPETIRRRMPIVNRTPSSRDFVEQRAVAAAGFDASRTRTLGRGVLVAVVDTGVDPLHPLLRHRLAPGGRDLVDGDDEPWETRDGIDSDGDGEVDEAAGHGTFVAGTVLLAAPAARVLALRALDDDGHGTAFSICQAVLTAIDRGADVLNMSFAGELRSRVLDRLLDEAAARGVVLVAGAGNDGAAALPFPARDHRVIAVAASGLDDRLADFSNRGDGVALSAPGVEIASALDLGQQGWWSGTSMAAPLVAGTAALLRAVNPRLGAADIEAALVQGAADPIGEADPPRLDAAGALALVPDGP